MKILELGRNFIRRTTKILERRILKTAEPRTYLPPEITIHQQPLNDVFDGRIYLRDLRLGPDINEGRSAVVYDIKGHPDLVARVKYGKRFKPEKLSFKFADPVRHIIAGTEDLGVTIMKKLKGYPLHGKYWQILEDPLHCNYFPQLQALKAIPDEAFIKYYNDILELRKMGYDFDTKNPNNILYDAEKQRFNLVDIEHLPGIKPEVTIEDFYPFIDGARLRHFYSVSWPETQETIGKEAREFLTRIANIGDKMGVNLEMRKITQDDPFPPFLNCLYYDHPKLRYFKY